MGEDDAKNIIISLTSTQLPYLFSTAYALLCQLRAYYQGGRAGRAKEEPAGQSTFLSSPRGQ
jgi:hypothetical protein